MRHLLLGALSVAAILFGDGLQDAPQKAKPVTVFAVRHAEKVDDSRDPELSAAGQTRAANLARLLGRAGVTHLFSSEFKRTRNTLVPLAEVAGLEIREISARSPGSQVEALRELPPGAIAVVAGHSNTIPQLVEQLGGEVGDLTPAGFIEDSTYDRLFVVTLPVGNAATQTVELRF